MLDSIRLIGRAYRDSFFTILCKEIQETRDSGKKEPIVLKIKFNFDTGRVEYDRIRFEPELAVKYRWIGHTFYSSREPVARLTFRDAKYFPDVIIHLVDRLKKVQGVDSLRKDLEEISEVFVRGNEKGLQNELRDWLRNNEEADVLLFTICLVRNGIVKELATDPLYDKAIPFLISPVKGLTVGRCYLCGCEDKLLSDPAFESGSVLKVYVVDQPGFLSGVSDKQDTESLLKTFALCTNCRFDLILGERKISQDFLIRIGTLPGYLIPRVYNDKQKMEEISKLFKMLCNKNDFLREDSIIEFDKSMARLYGWYSLTLVFGQSEGAHFSYYGAIYDVPVTNLKRLHQAIRETRTIAEKWGDGSEWILDLPEIAGLIPLKLISNRADFKPLLEILFSLLKQSSIPYSYIYELGVLAARIHRYENYSQYKLKKYLNGDVAIVHSMLKYNYLVLLMRSMGVLDTPKSGAVKLGLADDIQSWIEEMKYDESRAALFLLGLLVGKVGTEQYKKGDARKSILEKIDFKGMKWERIQRLTNEILASLRNYRILEYNEGIYYELQRLLNKSREKLESSDPQENLFYILTGYSFATWQALRGGHTA